jgi:hypothetical protein
LTDTQFILLRIEYEITDEDTYDYCGHIQIYEKIFNDKNNYTKILKDSIELSNKEFMKKYKILIKQNKYPFGFKNLFEWLKLLINVN